MSAASIFPPSRKPRQFTVKLSPRDGQYHNYFDCGGFERTLENARFIQRFDFGGPENCVLLFEEFDDESTKASAG